MTVAAPNENVDELLEGAEPAAPNENVGAGVVVAVVFDVVTVAAAVAAVLGFDAPNEKVGAGVVEAVVADVVTDAAVTVVFGFDAPKENVAADAFDKFRKIFET